MLAPTRCSMSHRLDACGWVWLIAWRKLVRSSRTTLSSLVGSNALTLQPCGAPSFLCFVTQYLKTPTFGIPNISIVKSIKHNDHHFKSTNINQHQPTPTNKFSVVLLSFKSCMRSTQAACHILKALTAWTQQVVRTTLQHSELVHRYWIKWACADCGACKCTRCVCVVEHGVASEQEEQEETHPSEKSDNQTEHETDAAEGSTTRRRRRYPDMIVPCKHRCKAENSYNS